MSADSCLILVSLRGDLFFHFRYFKCASVLQLNIIDIWRTFQNQSPKLPTNFKKRLLMFTTCLNFNVL